jgi:two-component system, LytTR family, response regulator
VTTPKLRIVVADDERPARAFLLTRLRSLPDVTIVGEAASGAEAIELIEQHRPDVALLDLQMPEVDGLGVVRLVRRRFLPLVIFVTAFDEYAVKAFDVNAVDYLTKPVSASRLREALRRAQDRLERGELRAAATAHLRDAIGTYERSAPPTRLERLPVRVNDDIVLLPVAHISSIVADGELLHVVTAKLERFTITYRLKDLESRLDPAKFIRLGRGALANIDHIARVTPLLGGMYTIRLHNGQELDVSRIQSRILRGRLLQI